MDVLRWIFIGWILFGSAVALAQDSTEQIDTSYGKGRLQTIGGEALQFNGILLGSDRASYWITEPESEQTIAIAEVTKIEVQSGTRAQEGFLGGIISGLVGGFLGTASWNRGMGQDTMDSDIRRAIVLGSGAFCGLVGWVVGGSMEKYETVYVDPPVQPESTFFPADPAPAEVTVAIQFLF
ncbi:MAG: hypothetical protein ABIF77_00320 [bacterium]